MKTRILLLAAGLICILVTATVFAAWRWDATHCGVQRAQAEWRSNLVLQVCARFGYTPAQSQLGMIYWGGSGDLPEASGFPVGMTEVEMNFEGRRWIETAAESGDAIAQNELGLAYLEGLYDVPSDYARARYWLEAAARNGEQIAPFNLARMHLQGLGVPASAAQAEAMLRVSVARHYKPSLCTLAVLLENRNANSAEVAMLRFEAAQMEGGPCGGRDLMEGVWPSVGNAASR